MCRDTCKCKNPRAVIISSVKHTHTHTRSIVEVFSMGLVTDGLNYKAKEKRKVAMRKFAFLFFNFLLFSSLCFSAVYPSVFTTCFIVTPVYRAHVWQFRRHAAYTASAVRAERHTGQNATQMDLMETNWSKVCDFILYFCK